MPESITATDTFAEPRVVAQAPMAPRSTPANPVNGVGACTCWPVLRRPHRLGNSGSLGITWIFWGTAGTAHFTSGRASSLRATASGLAPSSTGTCHAPGSPSTLRASSGTAPAASRARVRAPAWARTAVSALKRTSTSRTTGSMPLGVAINSGSPMGGIDAGAPIATAGAAMAADAPTTATMARRVRRVMRGSGEGRSLGDVYRPTTGAARGRCPRAAPPAAPEQRGGGDRSRG